MPQSVVFNTFSVLGTQNTRDLGTGVPKTRGYPNHCDTATTAFSPQPSHRFRRPRHRPRSRCLKSLIASRKLEAKIKKHQDITTLAVAKRDTVSRLLSKALNNNAVSAHEFDIILSEFQQYNVRKEQVRAKLPRQPSSGKLVDVDELEKNIRGNVESEYRKKKSNRSCRRFELSFENSRFHLHIIKT